MESKNDFNISAEKSIANRISTYKLNENEKAKIWQLAQNRDQSIEAERKDFRENFQDRYNTEYDRLRREYQNPNFVHTLDRGIPTDAQLRLEADQNVRNKHLSAIKNINQTTDKQINQILTQAREENRGPFPNLQQDFKRAHDHDHLQERG